MSEFQLPTVRPIPRVRPKQLRPKQLRPKQLRPMHTLTSRPRTSQYQISASKVNYSSYKPPTVSKTVSRPFAPAMIRTTGAWFIRPRFLNFPKIFKKKNQNFMSLIIFFPVSIHSMHIETFTKTKIKKKKKIKTIFFFFFLNIIFYFFYFNH